MLSPPNAAPANGSSTASATPQVIQRKPPTAASPPSKPAEGGPALHAEDRSPLVCWAPVRLPTRMSQEAVRPSPRTAEPHSQSPGGSRRVSERAVPPQGSSGGKVAATTGVIDLNPDSSADVVEVVEGPQEGCSSQEGFQQGGGGVSPGGGGARGSIGGGGVTGAGIGGAGASVEVAEGSQRWEDPQSAAREGCGVGVCTPAASRQLFSPPQQGRGPPAVVTAKADRSARHSVEGTGPGAGSSQEARRAGVPSSGVADRQPSALVEEAKGRLPPPLQNG